MNNYNKSELTKVLSCAIAIMMSSLVINAGPAITGAYTDGLGLSIAQVGTLLSMNLVGSGVSMITLIFFLNKLPPRTVLWVAAIGAVVSNLPVLFITNYNVLLGLFVLQGIFVGCIYATAMALLGESENQDRAFGISQFMQIMGAGAMLYVVPVLVYPYFGYQGVVVTLMLAYSSILFFYRNLPQHFIAMEKQVSKVKTHFFARLPSLMGLFSLFVCNAAITGIWMYAERMGSDLNIPPSQIGSVLATSLIMSVLGTLIPIFVGDKFGRILPYLFATGIISASFYCLYSATDLQEWALGIILLNISWAILLPYQFAQTTSSDPTGKLKVVVPALVGISAGVGVATVGQLFDGNYKVAFVVTIVAILLSAVAFAYSNIAGRRLEKKIKVVHHEALA